MARLKADFILSSGARQPIHLRTERDLKNACQLFHLTPDKVEKVMSRGQLVIMRGQSRKTFKGILAIESDLKRKGDELFKNTKNKK